MLGPGDMDIPSWLCMRPEDDFLRNESLNPVSGFGGGGSSTCIRIMGTTGDVDGRSRSSLSLRSFSLRRVFLYSRMRHWARLCGLMGVVCSPAGTTVFITGVKNTGSLAKKLTVGGVISDTGSRMAWP